MRTIEGIPALYNNVASLGVPAPVWDEVFQQMKGKLGDYDADHHSVTSRAFDWLVYDINLRQAKRIDYTRVPDISDHDYAAGLLKQADELLHAQ